MKNNNQSKQKAKINTSLITQLPNIKAKQKSSKEINSFKLSISKSNAVSMSRNNNNNNSVIAPTKTKKSKPPKDTSTQICDVFYFPKTQNIFLFCPNSSHTDIPIHDLFQIRVKVEIPFKYRMRIFNYESMPECISGTCQISDIALKTKIENSNIIWHLFPFDKLRQICFGLVPNQKFNHFPFAFQLGRKDNMYRHHKHLKSKFPKDYKYVPTTYILPFDEGAYRKKLANGKKCIWIAKPVNSSRGRGVHLLKENEFERLLKISTADINCQYLLSKYVSNPHLINMKKYDLRIYVLVTSFSPLKIYLYKEGLVRFATENYVKGNTDNIYIHLTNYSINKHNVNYINNQNEGSDEDDKSSKWSLEEYRNYFIQNGQEDKLNQIWTKIKDIVIKTLITVSDEANQIPLSKKDSLFELYGFDILIDNNYKAWLIEVNVNASLCCTSPLDLKIKTDLICDSFNIVGIIPYHHNCSTEVYNLSYDSSNYKKKEEDFEVLPPISFNNSSSSNNNNSAALKVVYAIKAKINKEFNKKDLKHHSEEYNNDYYKKMLDDMNEEFARSTVTKYNLVFPLKNNIDYYSQFLMYDKNPNDDNIIAWQWILTH